MKLGFFAALAACSLSFAAPASAQGVKIGILNDQSGVYADYGGKYSVEAARMAIEDFGGEVLGHKVEPVAADHQNKPDLAVSIARRWYDADGVDMITEQTTSTVALAGSSRSLLSLGRLIPQAHVFLRILREGHQDRHLAGNVHALHAGISSRRMP
jgi:uncharacterized protein YcfL